ncbi:phosphoglycerate kinase [Alphaproteobacteria bacterium]|nr:phosphoglycerate kinase [Alphaproteobacteria bacterium]
MKNLNNYKIENKKILFRADLNVPVVDGVITDTSRIEAIKSSIDKLTSYKNKIFLMAHFGRPKGEVVDKYSLNFILTSLRETLNLDKVFFLDNFDQDSVEEKVNKMQGGNLCLIENIRFLKEEENIDLNFAKKMSSLFDVYVNDAFSASHRNHTSITGFSKFLPAVAGNHMIKEIESINSFLDNAKKPNMAIVGGSKISTKIQLLSNLIEQFSAVAIGGAMANTFLLANNYYLGKSLVEKDLIQEANNIQLKAKKLNCELLLPVDVLCGKNIHDTNPVHRKIDEVLREEMILDIGDNTTQIINNKIINSKMVLWNGPVGAFEFKPYDKATNAIANIIKLNAKKLNINTLAGGGDTVSAIKNTNAEDGFSYISNAGGAFLEWLEGNESPGVKSLKENNLT